MSVFHMLFYTKHHALLLYNHVVLKEDHSKTGLRLFCEYIYNTAQSTIINIRLPPFPANGAIRRQ